MKSAQCQCDGLCGSPMCSSGHWEKYVSVCREAAQDRAQRNEEKRKGSGGQGPSRSPRAPDLPYILLGAKSEKRPQVDGNSRQGCVGLCALAKSLVRICRSSSAANLGHQALQKAQGGASSRQDSRLAPRNTTPPCADCSPQHGEVPRP